MGAATGLFAAVGWLVARGSRSATGRARRVIAGRDHSPGLRSAGVITARACDRVAAGGHDHSPGL